MNKYIYCKELVYMIVKGWQGKSEISVGPAMRRGRLELLDVG